MKFVFAMVSVLMFSAKLSALECDIGAAARCMCAASLMVQCDGGYNGNIKDDEKPTAIQVSVLDPSTGQTQSVWLQNPPGNIRDYYGSTGENVWVLRQLGDQGVVVRSDTRINFVAAKLPDDVVLYQDFDAKVPVVREGASAQGIQCGYSQSPGVASTNSCGSTKICFGTASCYENGVALGHFFNLSCSALSNGKCPSATACANDSSVHVGLSDQVDYSDDLSREKVKVTQ